MYFHSVKMFVPNEIPLSVVLRFFWCKYAQWFTTFRDEFIRDLVPATVSAMFLTVFPCVGGANTNAHTAHFSNMAPLVVNY